MAFGAELVWFWSEKLKEYVGRRLFKAEGCGSFVVLTFSGGAEPLLLSWNPQFFGVAKLSDAEKKKLFASATQLPPITNIIKSELSGAELVCVSQLNRDKLLEFSFEKTVGAGFVSKFSLVLEIMERYSNLILLDANRNIVEAAKHIHPCENRYRSVLPGLAYTTPPKIKGISLDAWLETGEKCELDEIAGLGKKLKLALEDRSLMQLKSELKALYNDVSVTAQIIGNYITVYPCKVNEYARLFSNYRLGKEELLAPLLKREVDCAKKRVIERIKHEQTRRQRQLTDILRLLNEQDGNEFKSKADLITANLWQLRAQTSRATIKTYDEEGVEQLVELELDPSLTPAKNAERLYARYKKITAAQTRAALLLAKVQAELEEFNEQLALAQSLDEIEEIEALGKEIGLQPTSKRQKKNENSLPPHKRFEFDFAIIVCGLSAKGNRYATFKFAKSDDIWFHAQGVPGSHVLLRYTRNATEAEREFAEKFCASLAACFCKTPVYGLRVDYCERKYVAAIPGQTANVTYKEFKSTVGDPFFWDEAFTAKQ